MRRGCFDCIFFAGLAGDAKSYSQLSNATIPSWRTYGLEEFEQKGFSQNQGAIRIIRICHAVASEVVLTTLGSDWWKSNYTSASTNPADFLLTDDLTENGRYDHQDCIVKLDHMLFALKSCAGFEFFINSFKSNELAPTFFELSVANILATNGFKVAFVERTGVKGSDYDLHISKDGQDLCVEAKSRRARPVLDERTLTNALNTARKQLPKTATKCNLC